MTVRSEDLGDRGLRPGESIRPAQQAAQRPEAAPAPAPAAKPDRLASAKKMAWPVRLLISFGMLVLACILWFLGASASVDGWILGLNLFLNQGIRAGLHLSNIEGPWRLVAIVAIGLPFSAIEIWLRPWRQYFLATLLLLVFVHAADVGSTLASVIITTPESSSLQTWAAAWVAPAVFYSILLTYAPEKMMLAALAIIRGK